MIDTLFSKMIPTFFRPNLEKLDVLRMLPGLRPRAPFVRGVHRGAFGDQKLRSLEAVARRPVQRRPTSGGFFPREPVGAAVGFQRDDDGEAEAPWEDDGSCGNAELSTRSTDISKTFQRKIASTNTLNNFQ